MHDPSVDGSALHNALPKKLSLSSLELRSFPTDFILRRNRSTAAREEVIKRAYRRYINGVGVISTVHRAGTATTTSRRVRKQRSPLPRCQAFPMRGKLPADRYARISPASASLHQTSQGASTPSLWHSWRSRTSTGTNCISRINIPQMSRTTL